MIWLIIDNFKFVLLYFCCVEFFVWMNGEKMSFCCCLLILIFELVIINFILNCFFLYWVFLVLIVIFFFFVNLMVLFNRLIRICLIFSLLVMKVFFLIFFVFIESLIFFLWVSCVNIGICFFMVLVRLVGDFLNDMLLELILEKFNILFMMLSNEFVFFIVIEVCFSWVEFSEELISVLSMFCILWIGVFILWFIFVRNLFCVFKVFFVIFVFCCSIVLFMWSCVILIVVLIILM